jgi:glucose-1-phosphate thymidylyltransferase
MYINDPESFGIVEFNKNSKEILVKEKPKQPKSNYSIDGLIFLRKSCIWQDGNNLVKAMLKLG